MSKNPYEIRLDVLKIAADMLENESKQDIALYEKKAKMLESQGIHIDLLDPNFKPKRYTEKDVISRASTMYSFIEDKRK